MPHGCTYGSDIHIDLALPALCVRDGGEIWAHLAGALGPRVGVPTYVLRSQMEARAGAAEAICVGDGLAALHVEIPPLARPWAVLAVLAKALNMDAPDGAGVDMVYLLLAPPQPPGTALRRIARVTRVLKDPYLAERLRAETCPVAALALVNGGAQDVDEAA